MTTAFSMLAEHVWAVLELPSEQREAYLGTLSAALAGQVLELLQFEAASLDLSNVHGVQLAMEVLAEPAPTQIGRWTVLRPLGRGGMASVFLVERRDGSLRQLAACKIGFASADLEDGLRRETATLLDLSHPGIAKVLDFGHTESGRPYMVSEWIDGTDIVSHCRRNSLGLLPRLRLFEEVLEAVAHAHERLLLHQDIKPDNILVDAAGRPRLIDFGLAALLSGQGDTPVLGYTRGYASPEQIRGDALTVRSDIHSLGVTLKAVIADLAPRSASDIWAVLGMACAVDPAARYTTVVAMAADLHAVRTLRPVSARPARAGYQLQRFMQRHPWPLVLATVLLLTAGFAVKAYVQQTRHAITAGQHAELQSRRATATSAFLTDLFTSVVPNEGGRVELRLSEFLQPAFDRLQSNAELPDGAKVDIAAALATAHGAIGDIDQASEIRRYGITLAHKLGDRSAEAHLLTAEADMLIARQELAAATAAYEQAIAIPHDDPQLRGRTLFSYMSAAFMTHDWDAVLLRARDLQARIDSGEVPPTQYQAGVAYSQATALMRLGRLDEAESAALRAQHAYVARFGEDSGPVASTLDIRMQIAMAANNQARAEALSEQSLRVAEHVYGKTHARYGELVSNAGLMRQNQGRSLEALELYRQAHAIAQASAGPDNPRAAIQQMNLGSILAALEQPGQRAEGIEHLRNAERTLSRTLGERHIMTVKAGGLLAAAQVRMGELGPVLQRLEAIEQVLAEIAPDSFERADLLASQAAALIEAGRYTECVQSTVKATTILRGQFAVDHWYFDVYAAMAAYCETRLGDADARARLADRVRTLESRLPSDSVDLALVRALVARLQSAGH